MPQTAWGSQPLSRATVALDMENGPSRAAHSPSSFSCSGQPGLRPPHSPGCLPESLETALQAGSRLWSKLLACGTLLPREGTPWESGMSPATRSVNAAASPALVPQTLASSGANNMREE